MVPSAAIYAAMNYINLVSVIYPITLIPLLSSCSLSTKGEQYLGEWVQEDHSGTMLLISTAGDAFSISDGEDVYPGIYSDGSLQISIGPFEYRIVHDDQHDHLLYEGSRYVRMNGDIYLGNWKLTGGREYSRNNMPNDYLSVDKIGNNYNLTFLPDFNYWGASGEFTAKLVYENGRLLKHPDDSGHFRVEIRKTTSRDRIYFSYVPFGHFEIRDNIYESTNMLFEVSQGDDFIGTWHIKEKLFITISKDGRRFRVNFDGIAQWDTYYKNKKLHALENPENNIDPNLPTLEFASNDEIKLSNYFFEGSSEHNFSRQ